MDNTDIKILRCLHENSRENASVIAEKINMSVSAVIERIKKLENNGIIRKYTAVIDRNLIGKDVLAYVSVGMEHPKFNDRFVEFVKTNKQIIECNYVTGDFDFILKINIASTKEFEKMVQTIKSVNGVSVTRTIVVLSTVKNDYTVCP